MYFRTRSAIISLALLMMFRMLGLFMVLPVLSVRAIAIPGATAGLIGVALGIYGLTQAVLQMPFGWLSDYIGRKQVIVIGLLLFAIGSVVAACATNISGLIVGRALQGMGAIGSTMLALITDLTRDESRSKAMALVGASIGLAFVIAIVIGPMVSDWFGLAGIFWLTAILAVAGLLLLTKIPQPTTNLFGTATFNASLNQMITKPIKAVLSNNQLLRLNFGIFSLHAILTMLFIAIPVLWVQKLHFSEAQQTLTYLLVLILAFSIVVPLVMMAEKKRQIKAVFIGAIVTLVFTQLLLYFYNQYSLVVVVLLFCFFVAFTLLESSLPSLVSKCAPIRFKGSAMGVYSTFQFLGIFIGGSIGGWVYSHFGTSSIFLLSSSLALIWLLVATTMQQPLYTARQ